MTPKTQEPELWRKYGLGVLPFEGTDCLTDMTAIHNEAVSYMEKNLVVQVHFLQGAPGFSYEEILEMVIGTDRMIEIQSRVKKMMNETMRSGTFT